MILVSQAANTEIKNTQPFMAYNEVVKLTAEEEGVVYADIASALNEQDLFLNDDIHYTPKGAEKLADSLYPSLKMVMNQVIKQREEVSGGILQK